MLRGHFQRDRGEHFPLSVKPCDAAVVLEMLGLPHFPMPPGPPQSVFPLPSQLVLQAIFS